MKILAITEQRDAKWNKVSFEILAAAQQIAEQTKSTISAVVIGNGVAGLADDLADYRLDEVLLVEHDLLANYTPTAFPSRSSKSSNPESPTSSFSRTRTKSATSPPLSPRRWGRE